jgi:hypothetical protein
LRAAQLDRAFACEVSGCWINTIGIKLAHK